jgi:phage/plasmid-like protein (TIGR03299 family)
MAHNINRVANKDSFASTKPAWHGLGQIVENAMTAAEAIELAGLDYQVIKHPNSVVLQKRMRTDEGYTTLPDSDIILNPDSYSTVRMDTKQVLGTVGNRYTVVQNIEAFDFFTEFAGETAAMFETAGALGKGEQIFISCKLPNTMVIGKNDEVEEYLLLVNSHNGNTPLRVLFTPVRVVCNNTLNQALHGYRMKVVIRHTNNIHDRLKEAHKLLGIHKISMDNRSEIFNLLYNTPVTDKLIQNYINEAVLSSAELKLVAMNRDNVMGVEEISTKKKNNIVHLEKYMYNGIGQKEILGTAWGIYNGFTGYYQNAKKYSDREKKLLDITEGVAFNTIQNVYEGLVNYAISQ